MNDYEPHELLESDIVRENNSFGRDQFRILRKLVLPKRFNEPSKGLVKRGLVVDVETTGFSHLEDKIIQLGMIPFDYEVETGNLLEVYLKDLFVQYQDPNILIPSEITQLTGIDNATVANKSIDIRLVEKYAERADLIIAHNSRFDRPFLEGLTGFFEKKPWSCSYDAIDWREEGIGSGKLEFIGMQFGWFYGAHDAIADCAAVVALLSRILPVSKRKAMSVVRDAAANSQFLIPLYDAFDIKDKLKKNGYQYRAENKVWFKICSGDYTREIEWLHSEVYGFNKNIIVQEINAFDRYTDRVWNYKS